MKDIYKNLLPENIPGSIFVQKKSNKIVIQVKGQRIYTGLEYTEKNIKIAEQLKINLYLEKIGLKEKTNLIKKNRRIKETFEEFIKIHCINLEPATVTSHKLAFKSLIKNDMNLNKENIENNVMNYINKTTNSNTTVNIYLRTFQVFLNFCAERDYLPLMKIYKNFRKKITEKPVQYYTNEEIDKLLTYFKNKDYQFYVLLILMLETGMRIKESITLTKKQIKKDRIELSNKVTKTYEFVIINSELRALILSTKTKDEKIFRWQHSTYSRLVRTLHNAMTILKIERNNRSFHEFRKTYLKNLYEKSTPVQIAQKLMRHKNITTTINNYTKIDDTELKKYQDRVQGKNNKYTTTSNNEL